MAAHVLSITNTLLTRCLAEGDESKVSPIKSDITISDVSDEEEDNTQDSIERGMRQSMIMMKSDSPREIETELDKAVEHEKRIARVAIELGAVFTLCYASGSAKGKRFVIIDPSNGDVIWMKPPPNPKALSELRLALINTHTDGSAAIEAFLASTGTKYKREKLIGVCRRANQVGRGGYLWTSAMDVERAFVLATESTQLILVAESAAVRTSWFVGCCDLIDRVASSNAIALKDAAQAAQVAAAQAEEAAAEAKAKAEAEAAAAKAKAEADTAAAKAKAEAEAAEAKAKAEAEAAEAKAKAEAMARAAQAKAVAETAEAKAKAAAEAAAAKAKAEAEAAAAKASAASRLNEERLQLDEAIQKASSGALCLEVSEEDALTCVICMEESKAFVGKNGVSRDGVACAGGESGSGSGSSDRGERHFLCNECFVGAVESSITDEPSKRDLRGGRVGCPMRTFPPTKGCCGAACFDDQVVAQKVDASLFSRYLHARDELVESRVARQAAAQMEAKLAAEVARIEKEGVNVFKAKRYIVDEILTMHCPRCKTAFVDWDGCNSLYCTVAGCGCNFCAFCLKDCGGGVKFGQKEIVRSGSDAVHKHVNECKYGKGIGQSNNGKCQTEVWNRVRKERIHDCLKEMCPEQWQREKVVEELQPNFKALGLTVSAPGGGAAGKKKAVAAATAPAPTAAARTTYHNPVNTHAIAWTLRKDLSLEGDDATVAEKAGMELGLKLSGSTEEKLMQCHRAVYGGGGKGILHLGGAAAGGAAAADEMPELPDGIKPCPACGMLIEKVGGDHQVMCGCLAKPAGGTLAKALAGGGCGHCWNFDTGAPLEYGKPGQPFNERQTKFKAGGKAKAV